MAFVLKVIGGTDEGKAFRLEPGDNLVGRSPQARITLRDESVAWEHALFQEEEGKVFVSNLSALGTRVRGRKVDEKTRLRNRDEVQLSDGCRVQLEERLGRAGAGRGSLGQWLALGAILLVVLGGGVFALLRPKAPGARALGSADWHRGYVGLEERLDAWSRRGWVPEEALVLFRDAWRLELARNYTAALEKWNGLRALLITQVLPSPRAEGRTMNQLAGPTDRSMRAVMGALRDSGVGGLHWDSDESHADALVWFVRLRAESCARKVQEEGGR